MSIVPNNVVAQINANNNLSPEQARLILQRYLGSSLKSVLPPSLVDFAQTKFYIPESKAPIQLLPHQISILDYALSPARNFQTIVFSTVKKSGKTALAAVVARWIAETWGSHNEVYCVANDLEQARGRSYQAAIESIDLDPNFNRTKRELPGVWRIIEKQATHLPSSSILRAIASDYKGEAGSNPTATFWSELWAYSSEASRRLWDELTPVPTRSRSIRYVETYAGFENESTLLIDLYNLAVNNGRRLTHTEIDWPFPDQPPIYINERARIFCYWDTGIVARRMPWQTPDYYESQSATLRPQAFARLHLNEWTSSVGQFAPVEWWDACKATIPRPSPTKPIVLAVDAAVSNDCCAIVGVSRNAQNPFKIDINFKYVWTPFTGRPIDYADTLDPTIRDLCSRYNVVEVAYDPYQLHKLMTDIKRDGVAWCRPFSQGIERARADKQLFDMIRDRLIAHDGDTELRDHLLNCAAKQSKDEDTNLRIVKKSEDKKIDGIIALSMAVSECLRLNL